MGKDLESPYEQGTPTWASLYRARGDEVSENRPIFTGDVFSGVNLVGRTGNEKARTVAVLQHPCSMRTNGVDLAWQVLVAEVENRKELSEQGWAAGHFNLMPLPELDLSVSTQARHRAINFDNLYMVRPEVLQTRIAALSPFGVNLLLQRWVHFSSRVVIPTHNFHEQTLSFYEEADLIEEWCDEESHEDVHAAASACMDWLRADRNGESFQEMLKEAQSHSIVRKAMRTELKARRTKSAS